MHKWCEQDKAKQQDTGEESGDTPEVGANTDLYNRGFAAAGKSVEQSGKSQCGKCHCAGSQGIYGITQIKGDGCNNTDQNTVANKLEREGFIEDSCFWISRFVTK